MKLYTSIYTAFRFYASFSGTGSLIEKYWRCGYRPHPIAPYADLITNYDDLSEAARRKAEQSVDSNLTQDELDKFRDYLWRSFRVVPEVHETEYPIVWQDNNDQDMLWPCGDLATVEKAFAREIGDDKNYDLDIKMVTVHIVSSVRPSLIYLSAEQESLALEFARDLLRRGNVPEPDQLRWVVNETCARLGLNFAKVTEGDESLKPDKQRTREAWHDEWPEELRIRALDRMAKWEAEERSLPMEKRRLFDPFADQALESHDCAA